MPPTLLTCEADSWPKVRWITAGSHDMSPQRLGDRNGCHEEIRNLDGSPLVAFSEQEWATVGAFDIGHYDRMVGTIHSPTIFEVTHTLREAVACAGPSLRTCVKVSLHTAQAFQWTPRAIRRASGAAGRHAVVSRRCHASSSAC